MRMFEELRIRNIEKNRIMKLVLEYNKRAIKEIKKSKLKCYDYQDVENMLLELNMDISNDKHWKKKRLGIL